MCEKMGAIIPVFARAGEPRRRQDRGRDKPSGPREATNLSVAAREGEVTLSGSIGNAVQAQRAVQVARGVEGAKEVQDQLVRESKVGLPATPHQSTVIDTPVGDNAATEKPRAK